MPFHLTGNIIGKSKRNFNRLSPIISISDLDLTYSITIYKSQGSEFEAAIIPVVTQHFKMLFRNLRYNGLTRTRKLAVFIWTRKAPAMTLMNQDGSQHQAELRGLLVDVDNGGHHQVGRE